MQRPHILVIGNCAGELTLNIPAVPPVSGVGECDSILHLPAGNGLYTAVGLARLGCDVSLCSRVGSDQNGDDLVAYLKAEKVDTRFIAVENDHDTELKTVICEDNGISRTLLYRGASAYLSPEDVENAFLSYPDAVILCGSVPEISAEKAVKLCRNKNATLFVTSSEKNELRGLHQYGCEVFSVSGEEAYGITGIEPTIQSKCLKVCMEIMNRIDTNYVILRLRDRGYFIYDGTYYKFVSEYDLPPVNVPSDNVFSAAFVLEYLRSEGNAQRSAEYGSIVTAVYVSRGGGLRGCPSDSEVRRFAARNKIDFKFDVDYFGDY